ncbi:hypothetical protein [Aquimarina aggregata]|uniref:hypothetical protein n=1 Tax=Aquimarina aggregata TaxID=1642818 RepID=UPI002490404A|nr:hypothetical protein [Aquimarina aggregata]
MNLLFLFLFTLILASCTSTDIEEEVALEELENERLEIINATETYLIDKDTAERPGNQGGN